MKRLFLVPITALLIGNVLSAQQIPFHCGAGEVDRIGNAANDPFFQTRTAQSNAELEDFTRAFLADGNRGGGAYVIPIVFHIIHNNGVENIDDAQILDALRILNEDYSRQNPDWDNVRPEFQDLVADVGVEFRLATKDPSGNCTNGITRTVSVLTNDGTEDMKALIVWPRNKYLNIWVSASADGAAGYTFRPGTAQWIPAEDGIVIQHNYTGSIGTSNASRSRALTHEVGHWFNLAHTWGDGNDPALAGNCGMDDGVSDTPNTIGWTTCTLSGASCGSPIDNVENYMEYSYCSKMFTLGQKQRMIAALNSSTAQRDQLWQTSNLINTGVNGNGPLCLAQFTSSSAMICAGGTVQYTDQSYHNVNNWTWSFPGGTPETSTEAEPLITYAESGIFPVTLTVSNGSGTLSTTSNDLVVVAADPGQAPPLAEGFESADQFTDIAWTTVNTNGDNGYTISNAAAFSGSKSARIVNNASMDGRLDQLISPTMDMSEATSITVSFRYAYAQRSATNDDQLRVFVSNNCGSTWNLRKQMFGTSSLNTGGLVSGNFVPNGPAQWGYVDIATISDIYHVSDFRVRFEFLSDGGNNFYLDDININGMPVGLEEMSGSSGTSLMVVPNPVTEGAQAVLNIPTSGRVRLELLDVLGRTIATLHDAVMPTGVRRIDLPVEGSPAGLYFLRMQQGGQTEVVRFTMQ